MPFASARAAFNKIMKELEDKKKKVIALYGMGGVGKTTLAVEVGKKAKELKLFDVVIVAVVSQCPSIEGIQDQIADMIGLHIQERSSVGKANRLRLRLEKIETKILIILDDLWAKLDLAAIGIPCNDDCKNCRVLLTTRQQQVCSVMDSQCDIPLDVLTVEEAWALFSSCGGSISNDPYHLTEIAKSVAKECKGLPLAIVTVAKALKGKTRNEWEVALLRLRGSRYVGISAVDRDVYKCIRFSYDYLQDKDAQLIFMVCSLFPEDHEIEVEQLVRYAYGLGLYRDVIDSIDRVRKEVHVVITELKSSSLLLSGADNIGTKSEKVVKMHDIIRDVALWISSNASMARAGMGLDEWPEIVDYQSLTRISLMKNKIAAHPGRVVCSKLNVLLLDENGCYKFPNDFFEEMKALQVLSVSHIPGSFLDESASFSLPLSFEQLVTLRILRIEWLKLDDISVLGQLKSLEILSLRGSDLEELPNVIGELNRLRMLDLLGCRSAIRVPANLLRKLAKLEELYIMMDGRDEGSCDAILSELILLSKLTILSLEISNVQCLHTKFCFPKQLVRYHIRYTGVNFLGSSSYPTSKWVSLDEIDASKVNAFKEIMPGVNSLYLTNPEEGCFQNIMPAIDTSGLNELTSLSIRDCNNMECLIDTTDHDWTPASALSRLDSLDLFGMNSFVEFICGLPPNGFFKDLQKLSVNECSKLCTLIPAKLSHRLVNLKEVTVRFCMEMKQLFEVDMVRKDVKENELLLSHLESLALWNLPELTRIWKGPTTGVVSLAKLGKLEVAGCAKLTSLLSLSHASSLVQLQVLQIKRCNQMKQIFFADQGRVEIQSTGDELNVWFPQLKVLVLEELPNFISFWHENYVPPLQLMPSLEELCVVECPKIGTHFIAELKVSEKKLQVLEVEGISLPKLDIITDVQGSWLVTGLAKVDELGIRNCKEVEELFQVREGRVRNASVGEHNNDSSLQLAVSWKELMLENVADLTCIWRGPSQLLIFHNLQYLSVTRCHGLKKHLFTTSIARSLLQLSRLEVNDCKELEQIFVDDESGDHGKKNIVELPKLGVLDLVQLPKLIRFCPSRHHFIFPSLQLSVDGCPNNNTGFFRGADEGLGTMMHAKGEALCSTENRGKCNDIHSNKSLPWYQEEDNAEHSQVGN